ncbi:hypothetical protein RND71_040675 [Anisodus tanguticus]|uniref:Uncharacterized protein n=1 Tax=Anisodus tanguticus TaxID=243964 RepID=A0AAE1QUH7_9SOLA|nr:hypothetical protein RND71_040675 [Anisodus tanguticus]
MSFPNLMILSLRSNKFDGELPQELCHLKDLQILDLANNAFVGIIPRCIGNFSAMVKGKYEGNAYQYLTILATVKVDDLNYSLYIVGLIESATVTTKGNMYRIPNGIGDMKVLESVDLSENQLYGQIPQSFSSLSTLSFLNLSDNNLSGMIPLSTQLQSFDQTNFQGNKLCGLPLLVNCNSGVKVPNGEYEEDESDKDEVDWFYISMAIGFALSFWSVCGSLLFKRSWRHAYFRFLDRSWEMLIAKAPIC